MLSMFLLIMLSVFTANGSHVIIDMTPRESIPPQALFASYTGVPLAEFDSPPVPPALKLQLVEPNDPANRKQGLMDVRLSNQSGHGIKIPISRDGRKVYEICGSQTLLTATVALNKSRDGNVNQQAQAGLYGCDAFKGSIVTLMAGDSITFAGLPFAREAREDGQAGSLTYSLDEAQYSQVGQKLKVVSRGLYYIQSR